MKRWMACLAGGLLAAAATATATAQQVPDVDGRWRLTVSAAGGFVTKQATNGSTGCVWEGEMMLAQSGAAFTGPGALTRSAGDPMLCPASFSGTVSGTVQADGALAFGLATGAAGTATFDGAVGGDAMGGAWALAAAGLAGEWEAQRHSEAPPAAPAPSLVPTLGAGRIVLIAAFAIGAALLLWRRG